MSDEKIGDSVTVETAAHPPRTDSPLYVATHKWLMSQIGGGCYVCGGPADLSHPDAPADSVALKLEDHHGGGIFYKGTLVALNLFPMEWSLGWGADPMRVAAFVTQLNEILSVLGEPTYDSKIESVQDVMNWVDSRYNANVKLCRPHHIGHQSQHTPDVNGNEACGIHYIPFPIWAGQVTCNWKVFDMWGGTTGTVAVSPHPSADLKGAVVVQHVDASHPVRHIDGQPLKIGDTLPRTHPHSRAAFKGASNGS